MTGDRPLPRPTELSEPFWAGCREGVLRVQRCEDCGHLVFVPRPMCPSCQHTELTWVDSAGQGRVYSFTVVHRAPSPSFEVPYVVAIIELEEGWHMLSNIVDCPVDEVRVDMPVQVTFREMSEEITLPYFHPRNC